VNVQCNSKLNDCPQLITILLFQAKIISHITSTFYHTMKKKARTIKQIFIKKSNFFLWFEIDFFTTVY
ncbi:MAG: hypothetical protein D8H99_17405, partial [Streptococcus sp.]